MLVGVSMLLLSAGALAELFDSVGTGVEFAAGLTAAALALIGVFSLLYGAAHVWASVLLRRCAHRDSPVVPRRGRMRHEACARRAPGGWPGRDR